MYITAVQVGMQFALINIDFHTYYSYYVRSGINLREDVKSLSPSTFDHGQNVTGPLGYSSKDNYDKVILCLDAKNIIMFKKS